MLSLKNGIDIKEVLNIGNALGLDNGLRTVNGKLLVNGLLTAGGNISTPSITAGFGLKFSVVPFKKFDIPHPTKGEGWRLAHTCLEGPEIESIVEEFWKERL